VGIDIFLEWDGMKNRPEDDKIDIFSVTSGHLGYLRESYRGGPYATQILVREAFESPDCRCAIPAAKMRARLTKKSRAAKGCNGGHAIALFMAQAVQKQLIKSPEEMQNLLAKNGESVAIHAPECVTPNMCVEDAVREHCKNAYSDMTAEDIEDVVQSFRDFVELAERREKEVGKPCIVYASY
jgi:hypothetical protein